MAILGTLISFQVIDFCGINVAKIADKEFNEINSQELWFEPTDVHKAAKAFQTDLWKTISVASPNLNELRTMISEIDPGDQEYSELAPEMEAWFLSKKLLAQSPSLTLLVTLGPRGVLVVRHSGPEEPFFIPRDRIDANTELSARLYPALPPPSEANLNESGAGDCLAAGVIARALRGCSETQAIAGGLAAALASLVSPYAVPDKFPDPHIIDKAPYHKIS
ncbi:hypothetical protein R5R35_001528 [Gryllus longicercus]|uniref:Carbohydrate kinase PfkB domain-containing protein n=1 Tax=Gryllus longicercus TaxID=2509291 RepID=A0AAN9W1B7_9ORTH